MSSDKTKTVGELATENPAAIGVFEKFKIDYCCGGVLSLEEACRNAGAETGEISEILARAANNPPENRAAKQNFNEMSLAALADYIVKNHHAFARAENERITDLLEKVRAVHGKNHAELIKIQKIFGSLRLEIENHLSKEERMLFPYIALMESSLNFGSEIPKAPFGSTKNPVKAMTAEHDAAGERLREIRALSDHFAVPPDACATFKTLYAALEEYEKDLHRHIHLENNILFPKAVEMEASGRPASANGTDTEKCGLSIFDAERR